jgi:hypothetical protein
MRAGCSPSARTLALCAAAVASALAAAAAAESKPVPRLDSPRAAELGLASALRDSAQSPESAALLAPGSYWGGAYRIATGESVTIYASNAYPVDSALGQRWADFVGSLVHGSELSSISVYMAPLSQVERVCGSEAYACYSAAERALIAPGEDPNDSLSAEAIVAHEYGHHVAANRTNAPWRALHWGTKRWASSLGVCARTRSRELWPGATDPLRYDFNPGEGFAESYRLLNERKAGRSETPWRVVSEALYPSAAALVALEQDVTAPWQQAASTTSMARLTRATRVRTYTVPTQLDGTLTVTLRPSAGLRLSLEVLASSTRVARAVGSAAVSRSTTICGQRTHRVRVRALRGTGTFSLTVAKP